MFSKHLFNELRLLKAHHYIFLVITFLLYRVCKITLLKKNNKAFLKIAMLYTKQNIEMQAH